MLELRVLGALGLTRADGVSVRSLLAQPKRIALLVYLVLGGPARFRTREALCALFWPELDDAHAHNALNQALFIIRRAVGEAVIETRGPQDVGVAEGAIRCDAVLFREAAARGDHAQACELFGGEPLPGFHVPGADGFERWLDLERRHLTDQAAKSAGLLTLEYLAQGMLSEAEDSALRAVELAPADETAVGELMDRLVDAGGRLGALRLYERWVETLERELGLTPSPRLQERVEHIRRATGDVPESKPSDAEEGARGRPTASEVVPPQRAIGVGAAPTPPSPGNAGRRRVRPWAVAVSVLVLTGLGWALASYLGPAGSHSFPVRVRGDVVGSFGAHDMLVVADFQAPPTQGDLALAVQSLLVQGLEGSGYVSVIGGAGAMSRRKLAATLEAMKVPPDTTMGTQLACSVAEREGAAGVVAGRILPLGDQYVLEVHVLRPVGCADAIEVSTTAPWNHLTEAVEALSAELRARLGEARKSIRNSPPLPPLTTASMEALRLYEEAGSPSDMMDTARTLPLLRDALRADPDFAVADLGLWSIYDWWMAYDSAKPHLLRAYQRRERLSREERLYIEAMYHRNVESNPWAALADLEQLVEEFPDVEELALPTLGVTAAWTGDWQRLLDVSLEMLRAPDRPVRMFPFSYRNGRAAARALGRRDLADSILSATVQVFDSLKIPVPPEEMLASFIIEGDWKGGQAFCEGRDSAYFPLLFTEAPETSWACGSFRLMRGQLTKATAILEPVAEHGAAGMQPLDRYTTAFALAYAEHLRGRDRDAWSSLRRTRDSTPLADVSEMPRHLARFLLCTGAVVLGDPDAFPECRVEREDPADWDRSGSTYWLLRSGAWSRRLLAVRSLARGDARLALRQVRNAVGSNFGQPSLVDYVIEGRAFEGLGQADSALVAYGKAVRVERGCFSCFPTWPRPFDLHLAWTHRRIGDLAVARGDTALALEHYRAFIHMWESADPELRPQVDEVKAWIADHSRGG